MIINLFIVLFIEIFTGFHGDRAISDVQAVIDAMKETLVNSIEGHSVSIVPATGRTGVQAGLYLIPVFENHKC